jgi:predicted O-methyltransferase YrrM
MVNKNHTLRLWNALSTINVSDAALLQSRLSWYYNGELKYDPPFAQILDDKEIKIIADWFAETNEKSYIGDSGFVAISLISDLILTNKIKSVIQLGHYAGFGSLIIGMMLRKVSPKGRLISFDIDDKMTLYSQSWMERASLSEVVRNTCVDASDPITLQLASAHLMGSPEIIFIDASKQYQNTIREIQMWRDYTHGYIIAHDVSKVAKSDQANGSLGVDDGMRDSKGFAQEELLIIDPATEKVAGFPYLDPCGLGIGVSRGIKHLPSPDTSFDELSSKRAILGAAKLRDSENWFLQDGFEFAPGQLKKRAGKEAWATCFAPVKSGQKLTCEVSIESDNHHDVMICAGGLPGTTFSFSGSGTHVGQVIVGNENSLVGIFGSPEAEFRVVSIRVTTSVDEIVAGNTNAH